jgi:transcriptional regulator with XRE-family HTH domain
MSDELLRLWGTNIRSFRRARDAHAGIPAGGGMKAMADHLDVSVATVSRWETGRMSPRDEHKVDIAEYLEVDVRAIFPLVRMAS